MRAGLPFGAAHEDLGEGLDRVRDGGVGELPVSGLRTGVLRLAPFPAPGQDDGPLEGRERAGWALLGSAPALLL